MWLHRDSQLTQVNDPCARKTYPASKICTNVTLPAVKPSPPALRTVPALRPLPSVIQGAGALCANSSWNLFSSFVTHASLPYTRPTQLPARTPRNEEGVLTMKLHIMSALPA